MLRKYTIRIAHQISDTAEDIYAGHVINQKQDLAVVFYCIWDSRAVSMSECTINVGITAFQARISRVDQDRFSKVLELVYHPRPASASGALSLKAVAEVICDTLLKYGSAIILPHDIEAVLLRSGDLEVVPDADVLVPKADPSREDIFRIKTVSAMDWVF